MAGTHLKRIPRAELREDYKSIWDTMDRLTGDPTSIEILAHNPAVTDWYFNDFYRQIFANERPGMLVDVPTKHLLRLRLSKQHGCAQCNRGNEEQARAIGFSDAQIDNLLEDMPSPSLFNEPELAVIEFADQMLLHNMDGHLGADLYNRLGAHFNDAQIVELATVSAVLVGSMKMRFVLDLVPRDANCPFPNPHEQLAQAAA